MSAEEREAALKTIVLERQRELGEAATTIARLRQERNEARAVAAKLAAIAKRAVIGVIPDTAELFSLGLVVADWAPRQHQTSIVVPSKEGR